MKKACLATVLLLVSCAPQWYHDEYGIALVDTGDTVWAIKFDGFVVDGERGKGEQDTDVRMQLSAVAGLYRALATSAFKEKFRTRYESEKGRGVDREAAAKKAAETAARFLESCAEREAAWNGYDVTVSISPNVIGMLI